MGNPGTTMTTTWNDYAYIFVRADRWEQANNFYATVLHDLYPYFELEAQKKTFSVWVSDDGTWKGTQPNQLKKMYCGTSTRITPELLDYVNDIKENQFPSYVEVYTSGEVPNVHGFVEVGDFQGALTQLQADLGWIGMVVMEPDENGENDPVPPEYRP